MTEHRLYPPHENVLLNPSLQNFPRSRVKKPLYGVEYVDYPLLIAAPKRHFQLIILSTPHVSLHL